MDENRHSSPEQDRYQTGSTQPPKSSSGVIALLLVLVVLLTGAVGMLGMQNIQLFRALQERNLSSLTDSQPTSSTSPTISTPSGKPTLGIRGDALDPVSQDYFALPSGLFITYVYGNAQKQGLRSGDILLTLDGQSITTLAQLDAALQNCQMGQQVAVTYYRDQQIRSLTLTVEEAAE